MGDPRKEIVSSEEDTLTDEELEEILEEEEQAPMEQRVRLQPIVRTSPKIGRNQPCPCGMTKENGRPLKYKHCCLARSYNG